MSRVSHKKSKGFVQSGATITRVVTSVVFKLPNAYVLVASKTNRVSCCSNWHMGFDILEKSLMNLQNNPYKMSKKRFSLLALVGGSITTIFALSTSNPFLEILWPNAIASCTIKWNFSQSNTRLVASHLFTISSNLDKQCWNISQNTKIIYEDFNRFFQWSLKIWQWFFKRL